MFKHHGMLVGYAAFKDHCSLFMSTHLTGSLRKAVAPYVASNGTIRFAAEKPLPATLVRKLVKARIARNERKRLPHPIRTPRSTPCGGSSPPGCTAASRRSPATWG